MANTFELIASSTVGSGGASSIIFSSIPSTYTDLCLKISSRQSTASIGLKMVINGYTAFSGRVLEGSGSSASSYSMTPQLLVGYNNSSAYTASSFGSTDVYIPNYLSTTSKSVSGDSVTETNASTAYSALLADLYTTTAAINSITLSCDASGNFEEYSTAYLYGVKNA